MANTAEAINLDSAREPLKARTAFLVVIAEDGSVRLSPDVNVNLTLERFPHPDEVRGACVVIQDSLAGQHTAQVVMQSMQALGERAASAAEAAEIRKNLRDLRTKR